MNYYPSFRQLTPPPPPSVVHNPSSPINFLTSPPPDVQLKLFCLYCRNRIPQIDYVDHFVAHDRDWHPCNEHYDWFGRNELESHVHCLLREAVRYSISSTDRIDGTNQMAPVTVVVCELCGFCAEDEERLKRHFYWSHQAIECQACHVVLCGEIGRGVHQPLCDRARVMPPWTPVHPAFESTPPVPNRYQSMPFGRSIGGGASSSSALRIHSIDTGPIAPILRQADIPTPISYAAMEHLARTGRMMNHPMMVSTAAGGGGRINRSIDGQQLTGANAYPIDPGLARMKRVPPPVFIIRTATAASTNANETPAGQQQQQPTVAVAQSRIDRSAGETPQRPLQSILKRRLPAPSFDARCSSCHNHTRFNFTPSTSPDHGDEIVSSSDEIEEEDERVQEYFPTIKRSASAGATRSRPTKLVGGSRGNYQRKFGARRTPSAVDRPRPASSAAVDQQQSDEEEDDQQQQREESIPPTKRGRPPKTERVAVKTEQKPSLRPPAVDMTKYEYACNLCDFVTLYKVSVRNHVNKVHQIPFEKREQWYELREKQSKLEDGADDRGGTDGSKHEDGEEDEDDSTTNGDDGDDQIASTSAASTMAPRKGIVKKK